MVIRNLRNIPGLPPGVGIGRVNPCFAIRNRSGWPL